MNEQIWKYELDFPKTIVLMPKGAEIIALQVDIRSEYVNGYADGTVPPVVFMWARVDPEAIKEAHTIFSVGTGQNFDSGSASYIGTIQEPGGVWHYFDDDEATWERD